MSGLNTRTAIALLNDLHPDPALIHIALGRQVALNALAAVAGGIGAAIADLDEKIYPSRSERQLDTDRRWRIACAHLDSAARTAGDLDQALQGAALRCPRVIADLEPVLYHGSLKQQHGVYTVDGPCICIDCDDLFTLQLQPTRPGKGLTCVNPSSVSPAPEPYRLDSGHRFERALHTAISDLPTPIEAAHAVSLIRAMSTVTGRARTVLTCWHDLIQRRFAHVTWMFDPAGSRTHRQHLQHILDTLDRAGPALTTVHADLRKAIGVLADLESHPHRKAA